MGRADVHITISDLVAPFQMLSDDATKAAQEFLYPWIVRELGPLTPVFVQPMRRPASGPDQDNPSTSQKYDGYLLSYAATDSDYWAYVARWVDSRKRAAEAGLLYALPHETGAAEVRCHACGGLLVRVFRRDTSDHHCVLPSCILELQYCPFRFHEQHVSPGGCCEWCGAKVPVIVSDGGVMWQWRANELKPFAPLMRPRADVVREYQEKFMAPEVREILLLCRTRLGGFTLEQICEQLGRGNLSARVVHAIYVRALAQMTELQLVEQLGNSYHLTARGWTVARGVVAQPGDEPR